MHAAVYYADINECSTNNGGCAGTCTNTAGSYYCTCSSGCTLGSNGHVCNGRLYNYCSAYKLELFQTTMNALLVLTTVNKTVTTLQTVEGSIAAVILVTHWTLILVMVCV